MAKHWAIAIGINTYSSFQTLRYAQNDAEAFCRELIERGRVTPENCLLMTTASALHLGQSTFPLRNTLLQWFQWLVNEALQPEDQLWVFFSGYGIHAHGQDYLMPIDGDPKQPQDTGISLASLFQQLQKAPTDRILMLLDMNHNEGSLATPVGIQTAKLAQQTGIATLQSCQPQKGEFSRKAAGLNHGFFTAALLPALRNPDLRSLQSLSQDLERRMEELSEHYWRPEQTPLTVGNFTFDPIDSQAQAALISGSNGSAKLEDGQTAGESSLFSGGSEASVTPLDVNYVSSTSTTGLGDQFSSAWNWTETSAGTAVSGNSVSGSAGGNNVGSGTTTTTQEGGEAEAIVTAPTAGEENGAKPEIDPYAAVWEEDHGQPLDESQVNQNYGPVALPAPAEGVDEVAQGSAAAEGGDGDSSAYGDGAYGDNGDNKAGASSWHWPDWVVAPAQNGSSNGSSNSSSSGSSSDLSNGHTGGQLAYPEPPPVVPDSMPGSSPGPGSAGTDFPGPDLAAASQGSVENADFVPEFSGGNAATTGSAAGSPAVGGSGVGTSTDGVEEFLEAEEPLDIEREDGVELIAVQPELPGQEPFLDDSSQTIDVKPVGSNGGGYSVYSEDLNGDFDDDGGLPIIELDPLEPEDDAKVAVADTNSKSSLPGWFNLRLLGATGLVLLTAFGLLGWFRTRDRNFAQDSETPATATPVQPATTSPEVDTPDNLVETPDNLEASSEPETPNSDDSDDSDAQPSQAEVADAQGVSDGAQDVNDGNGESASDEPGDDELANAEPATIQAEAPSAQVLKQAQDDLQPGQASSYNQAISNARTIPSSDPNYKAARQQMDRWSQEMMTLADQRAETGDYLGAIAAARLVPSDLLAFPDSQESIAQWQAPAQLQHAKALVKPGLASSYNQAISVARGIPAGIPASVEAEQLRQDWSREILTIAEGRAQRGQWVLAIAAAQLVPPDMEAYSEAQASITQWQTQPRNDSL